MYRRNLSLMVGAALVALLASTGCVSKKVFRKNVQETDTRITGLQTGVEANERRVTDLGRDTDSKISTLRGETQKAVELGNSALNEAKAAQQAAKGKILWTVTLSDDSVKFSFGQVNIPPQASRALDELANRIKEMNKTVYVEIEGHTDSIGSADYNLKLGERRARAVLNYLHEKGGLPLHAMNAISYGKERPIADNKTPQGRSQNRRVVVRVLE